MPVTPLSANAQLFVTMRGELNAQRILNTFQYHLVGTPDPLLDYHDYLDVFLTAFGGAGGMIEKYMQCMPANYVLDRVRLQPTYPVRLRYGDYVMGTTGEFANSAKTSNLAASIRRVTDVLGRRGVGRVQMPLPEDTFLEGKLSDADGYVTDLGVFGVQMLEPITTVSPAAVWEPVIFTVVGGIASTGVLIDAVPEDTVRVMRRRTVRLGE